MENYEQKLHVLLASALDGHFIPREMSRDNNWEGDWVSCRTDLDAVANFCFRW